VQIIAIMTILVNGIRNGSDSLTERYMLGKNLMTSTILYVVISLIIMIIFNMVAGLVMGNIGTTT